jgi:peptidoglycan/LPS O-acetylase OafA/YrhL
VRKDVPLEGVRGLAAIAVMLGHTVTGFAPYLQPIRDTPFNLLINGDGAVIIFFVLSGYVLTRQYFVTGRPIAVLRGVLKRWPRLMGPVLVTVLASWLLFVLDAYEYREAGALSGSAWLSRFGNAPDYPFEPSLQGAIREGALLTFVRPGSYNYDTALWTMRIEFAGSMLSFAMALLLVKLRPLNVWLTVVATPAALVLCRYLDQTYCAFIFGVLLARLMQASFRIPPVLAFPLLAAALFLLGYTDAGDGVYHLLHLSRIGAVYVLTAAAFLAIGLILSSPELHRMMDNRYMAFVGELSFPLYLVHTLVICSAGSRVFVLTGSLTATALTVVAVSVVSAMPIFWFNRIWVRGVNASVDAVLRNGARAVSALFRPRPAPAPGGGRRLAAGRARLTEPSHNGHTRSNGNARGIGRTPAASRRLGALLRERECNASGHPDG